MTVECEGQNGAVVEFGHSLVVDTCCGDQVTTGVSAERELLPLERQ